MLKSHRSVKKMQKPNYKIREVDNFRDLLFKSKELYSEKIAFVLPNEILGKTSFTYNDFYNDVVALSTKLIDDGYKNKKIILLSHNSYQWCVIYFAVTCIGSTIIPLDPDLPYEELKNIIKRCKADLMFVDEESFEKLSTKRLPLRPKIKLTFDPEKDEKKESYFQMITEGNNLVLNEDKSYEEFQNIEIDSDKLSVLLFTSGTTQKPKAVMLSQRNICFDVTSTLKVVKTDENDRYLTALPLFHTYMCSFGLVCPLYLGASVYICKNIFGMKKGMKTFEPTLLVTVPLIIEKAYNRIVSSVNKNIDEKNLNESLVSNEIFQSYVMEALKKSFCNSLRLIITGAAAMNPSIVSNLRDLGIRIYTGYGLSECAPVVSLVGDKIYDNLETFDTVGLPIPGVNVKIKHPDKKGVGEIRVKGDNVMLGYYNDDRANKQAFDKDGYFKTGDLGQITEQGYIKIVGRLKNVIVSKNGKNIYPEEVEFYLNQDPFVAEAVVTGYPEEYDTLVKANIFPNFDAIKEKKHLSEMTDEEVKKALEESVKKINSILPGYKHIRKIEIKDCEFEKTSTAKIKKVGNNNV